MGFDRGDRDWAIAMSDSWAFLLRQSNLLPEQDARPVLAPLARRRPAEPAKQAVFAVEKCVAVTCVVRIKRLKSVVSPRRNCYRISAAMGDLDDLAKAASEHTRGQRSARQSPPVVQQTPRGIATDRVWMIHYRSQQFGPHTEHEIAMLLGAGQISAQSLVWREGSPRWIPVTNLVPAPSIPPLVSHAYVPNAPVVVNINNVNSASLVARPSNGLGTASLALGVVSMVFTCLPFISIPVALLGLVLGIAGIGKGNTEKKPTGAAIAGVAICGIVLLLAGLILAGFIASASKPHGLDSIR